MPGTFLAQGSWAPLWPSNDSSAFSQSGAVGAVKAASTRARRLCEADTATGAASGQRARRHPRRTPAVLGQWAGSVAPDALDETGARAGLGQ